MIGTLLTICFGVVILAFMVTIILLVAFVVKLMWDYVFDNY